MQGTSARVLDESERRLVAATMLAAARGAPESPEREARRDARRRAPVRRRERRPTLPRDLAPFLLLLPEKLGFRAAFCAAVAAWGAALVLSLGCFEVVRW